MPSQTLAIARNRTSQIVAAAAVAFAVTACSAQAHSHGHPVSAAASQPSTAPAGQGAGQAGNSACSLATSADMAGIFGESFRAGQASSPGGQSDCLFVQRANSGLDTVGLLVVRGTAAGVFYTTNATVYHGTAVHGLGDKAFASADGGQIGVQQGSLTILIHLVGFTSESATARDRQLEALARLVLSRAH